MFTDTDKRVQEYSQQKSTKCPEKHQSVIFSITAR